MIAFLKTVGACGLVISLMLLVIRAGYGKGWTYKNIGILALTSLVLSALCFPFSTTSGPVNKQSQSTSTQQQEIVQQAEIPIEITTAQLRKDYNDNLFAADNKYKGKLLNVTGAVLFIDKDSNGKPCIDFIADTTLESIICTLTSSDDPQLIKIAPHKIVTIQGRCAGEGETLLGHKIIINECKIISVGDNPEPTNTKQSLAYQYYYNQSPSSSSDNGTNWKRVSTFTGSSKQDTKVFHIESGHWRIRWNIQPPLMGMEPYFKITVYTNHGVFVDQMTHNDELIASGTMTEETPALNNYWLQIESDLQYVVNVEELD